MKNIIQRFSAVVLCLYCASAAPQALKNAYLPPEEGYHYDAPSVSFPTPPQSTYRPILTSPRPRPPLPPLQQSGSAISPVGQEGAGLGGGEFDHLRQPHVPGMPFDFQYAVKDDQYGNDYSHSATSNGDQVRGEYRTLLPDGRLQIVRYIADWKDGYTAEVSYQGEAQYPQPGASGSNIAAVGYRPRPSPSYPIALQPGPAYPSPYPINVQPSPASYPSRPAFSGSGYNPVQQPGPSIPSYQVPITSPKPLGPSGYGQQPVSGYGGGQQVSGYGGSQQVSGYGGSQQVSGYGDSQQPISGYGGSGQQPSSNGYPSSSPAPGYSSTSDYGSYKK